MEGEGDGEDAAPDADAADAVYPWVAGFATALELFPALIDTASPALTEPLALLYRHLDADDLEDADELLAEIDSMEPAADLTDAVEGLVRATLLLADIGRPLKPGAGRTPAARKGPARSRRSRSGRRAPRGRPGRRRRCARQAGAGRSSRR